MFYAPGENAERGHRISRTRAALFVVFVALTSLILTVIPTSHRALPVETPKGNVPPAVIYDSDMDFDDAATLAYLCQEHKQHRISLVAVTIANTGLGTPGRSVVHARSILQRCGLSNIPVAEGATVGGNNPPPELRAIVETVLSDTLQDGGVSTSAYPSLSAGQLLATTVANSPRHLTVLATGPLTNVAAALSTIKSKNRTAFLDNLYVMGGAINVPGNLFGSTTGGFDNSQEFNMWLDPLAARNTFIALPNKIRLVPLDATQYVPVTRAFIDRLGTAAHTPEAQLVNTIISHPGLAFGIDQGAFFWWDALAAISAFRDPSVVQERDASVSIVPDGVQAGRIVESPSGTPIRVAIKASQADFEQDFLDALNGNLPS
jgi:purine nucleosidase